MIENKELFKMNMKIAEEFTLMVKSQYDLQLDFSQASIRALEDAIEMMKYASGDHRKTNLIGLSAYLGQLLIMLFQGYWFQDNLRPGVELIRTSLGENTVIYPCAWVEERLSNGLADSIKFKIEVLSSTATNNDRSAQFCVKDAKAAEHLATGILLDPVDKAFIDQLVQYIASNKDNMDLIDFSSISHKARIYLKSRIIKLYDANPFNWKIVEKIQDISSSLSRSGLKLTAGEFAALLKYLQDSQFDPNGELFKNLWTIEKDLKILEKSDNQQRSEILILLLKLIERKIYHHDIIDFKKVLCLINADNLDVIEYLQNLSIKFRQGCYQAITHMLSCRFNTSVYSNFNIQRLVIIWLDNATGKSPQNPWKEKLSKIELECTPQDISKLCQWIYTQNELRYDKGNHWLDSVFTRFQKSAKWYLNKEY
jgi:hypothetical protein